MKLNTAKSIGGRLKKYRHFLTDGIFYIIQWF